MTTNLPAPPPEIANRQRRRLLEDASTGLGIPRPAHVSIRGGQFALVRADGARMQLPTTYFDFVVVDVLRETSRVLFPEYQPQSEEPPICYSDNGVGPSYMALQPQSPICETCRWNERGSAQTFTGKDTTACTKSKKLAVIIPGDPQLNIYEFRIGPGSLTNLKAYTAWIGTQANNLDIADFVTRAKWDPQKQFTMVFEAVGWANQNDPTMLQKLEYIETNKLGDAVVNRIDRPADPQMVAQRLQLSQSAETKAMRQELPSLERPQFQLPPQAPPAAPAPQAAWQQTAQWQPAGGPSAPPQLAAPQAQWTPPAAAPTPPAAAPKQTRTRKPRGQTPDPVVAGVQAPAQAAAPQAPPQQFSPPGPPNGGFQPPGFVPQVGPGTRLQEPAGFNPAPPAPAQPQFGMGQPAAPPSSLADAMNMLPPRQ